MEKIFLTEIEKINKLGETDSQTIKIFINRVNEGKLVKRDNLTDHFCSFFVPVHRPTKSIFIGHHIKAGTWIPPGGHIEPDEKPFETVRREFTEELGHKLTDEPLYPFTLSISDIKNKKHPCRRHYDFWYLVECNRINFKFDRGEFHAAGWFTLNEAVGKCGRSDYVKVLKKLTAYSIPINS